MPAAPNSPPAPASINSAAAGAQQHPVSAWGGWQVCAPVHGGVLCHVCTRQPPLAAWLLSCYLLLAYCSLALQHSYVALENQSNSGLYVRLTREMTHAQQGTAPLAAGAVLHTPYPLTSYPHTPCAGAGRASGAAAPAAPAAVKPACCCAADAGEGRGCCCCCCCSCSCRRARSKGSE